MSADGKYVDLRRNTEDPTTVLVARARPMAQPVEYTKKIDTSAEEITITTGLDDAVNINGLLVKVSMCDESQEVCE